MTPQQEALELLAKLGESQLHVALALVLKADELEMALAQPETHKQQPLARLVRTMNRGWDGHPSQVLANVIAAVRVLRGASLPVRVWMASRLTMAATDPAFENAASALAEIRAGGWLLSEPRQPNLWVSQSGSGSSPRPWYRAISACS